MSDLYRMGMDLDLTETRLREAQHLIETVGWTQGEMRKVGRFTGRVKGYCAFGALLEVEHVRDLRSGGYAQHAFQYAVGKDIIAFNDDPGRTKDQVVMGFELAIELVNEERRRRDVR